MNQKQQYIDAKLKLEDQLLKLKEEREELKERGNKHEDKIMRDNAKLQVIQKYIFIIQFKEDFVNNSSFWDSEYIGLELNAKFFEICNLKYKQYNMIMMS